MDGTFLCCHAGIPMIWRSWCLRSSLHCKNLSRTLMGTASSKRARRFLLRCHLRCKFLHLLPPGLSLQVRGTI